MTNKTIWVQLLPENVKVEIEKDLRIALEGMELDITGIEDAFSNGMDSRLCDLSDTLDINKYIDMLPKLDDGLLQVVDYLQRIDRMGNYNEMVEEYALGDIELETIKDTLTVLIGWMVDNTSPDDTKQAKELKDMLRLII